MSDNVSYGSVASEEAEKRRNPAHNFRQPPKFIRASAQIVRAARRFGRLAHTVAIVASTYDTIYRLHYIPTPGVRWFAQATLLSERQVLRAKRALCEAGWITTTPRGSGFSENWAFGPNWPGECAAPAQSSAPQTGAVGAPQTGAVGAPQTGAVGAPQTGAVHTEEEVREGKEWVRKIHPHALTFLRWVYDRWGLEYTDRQLKFIVPAFARGVTAEFACAWLRNPDLMEPLPTFHKRIGADYWREVNIKREQDQRLKTEENRKGQGASNAPTDADIQAFRAAMPWNQSPSTAEVEGERR